MINMASESSDTLEILDTIQQIEPYMFEPNKEDDAETSCDSSESSTTDDEEFDEEFEAANALRLCTLKWCKCGECAKMEKTIESFCCHEKAIEYDEYDAKLADAQQQTFKCITSLSSFKQNML